MTTREHIGSEFDKEGFLLDFSSWTTDIAQLIAEKEGVTLLSEHWKIIFILREFYKTHQLAPPMRPLVTLLRRYLGLEEASSQRLMLLFGGSPAKTACKISGLPRPATCI